MTEDREGEGKEVVRMMVMDNDSDDASYRGANEGRDSTSMN